MSLDDVGLREDSADFSVGNGEEKFFSPKQGADTQLFRWPPRSVPSGLAKFFTRPPALCACSSLRMRLAGGGPPEPGETEPRQELARNPRPWPGHPTRASAAP